MAEKGKSVFTKYKEELKKAAEANKNSEPKADTARPLPAGIDYGYARLNTVKFGKYKTGALNGEPFFMAMASVLSPKEFEGKAIDGLMTRIGPYPCGPAWGRTMDDNLAIVQDELKKIIRDPATKKFNPDELDGDNLENTVETLQTMCEQGNGPVIAFRTYEKTNKTTGKTGVGHIWMGAVEYVDEGGPAPGADDDVSDDLVDGGYTDLPPDNDGERVPEVDQTCKYKLEVGGVMKEVKCTIVSVNEEKRTVTLKKLTDQKVIAGSDRKPVQVSWSDIEQD